MSITLETLKDIVSHQYPETIIYTQAKAIKEGHGKHKRLIPRKVGVSISKRFSMDVFGTKRKLSRILFMISLQEMAHATYGLRCATEIIKKGIDGWDDAEWLLTAIKTSEPKEKGPIKVSFMNLGSPDSDVYVLFIDARFR